MTYRFRRVRGGRKMRRVLLTGVAFVALGLGSAFAQSANISTPEQPLAQSLKDIARQTGENILFTPDAVAGLNAHALSGQMTAQEAVNALIAGTGLEVVSDGNGGLIVRRAQAKKAQAAPEAAPGEETELVVVTGTHIAGTAPVGSQVNVYTRVDLDQSGAATLEQFARQIPENLANTDALTNMASNAALAVHPGGDSNNNSGAAFNIGGLGVSSTLTLIDGHRFAAAGDLGSFVDISMIPLSAIDHVEILQDGASSIYGSDAVGGVVNIIMKKDFDGAESSLRYGGATDGGADEFTVSQVVGKAWSTGNALLDYEYDSQTGLDAAQRGYIPPQGGPTSLLPESQRTSLFFSGNQDIDSLTTISGEAFYSHKNTYLDQALATGLEHVFLEQPGQVSEVGGVVSVDRKLWGDWDASITGNYSSTNQAYEETESVSIPLFGISETAYGKGTPRSGTYGVDALTNGSIWTLPGGDIKTAIGASYRSESFATSTVQTVGGASTFVPTPTYTREVESVFGEVYIPLVGDANALPYLRRLDISGAVRYDNYSDFGSTTNPKVGLEYKPVDDVKLRGTWGTSFRAPLLTELHSPPLYQAEPLPDASAPGGATDTLIVGGGNPDLQPETATVFTAGGDWIPGWDPAFTASMTYTNVSYKKLIGPPPVTDIDAVFSDPLLAPFINRNPNAAFVQSAFASPYFSADYAHLGPAGVMAILYDNEQNLAAEQEANIDFRLKYNLATDIGAFVFSGIVDDFVTDTLKSAPTAPAENILNTFGEPARWKGRISASWSDDGYTAMLTVNYVNAYNDTLATPTVRIASWTTEDLYLGYALGPSDGAGLLQNLRLSLSMQNIMDTKPPFVLIPASTLLPGQNPLPIDPVNASPVGRLIAVQLTKDF